METLDLVAWVRARRRGRNRTPGFYPGDMLRLYILGYLNQLRSSRQLERACQRDLEAIWMMRRMSPDYWTIAAFRHDNPEAIVGAGAAFISFCREAGLIAGTKVRWMVPRWGRCPAPRILPGLNALPATSRIPKRKSPMISILSTSPMSMPPKYR